MNPTWLHRFQLSKQFLKLREDLLQSSFTRSKHWPLLQSDPIRSLFDHSTRLEGRRPTEAELRKLLKCSQERLDEIRSRVAQEAIPSTGSKSNDIIDQLLLVAGGSKNWADPRTAENVATISTDPALVGAMIGIVANANLVHREYSHSVADLESTTIKMLAELVGFDATQATGLFTSGGTFGNLYGILSAIRWAYPNSREFGLPPAKEFRIINSMSGHYSVNTTLELLGINSAVSVIRLRIDNENAMDLSDLEHQLDKALGAGKQVPVICVTMGTTDSFAVDPVAEVVRIRDKLAAKHGCVPGGQAGDGLVTPHIHVDAAVGWPLLFFNNYDWQENPRLRSHAADFKAVSAADSVSVDLHKWGFAPYASSAIIFKHRQVLHSLRHDQESFSYFTEADGGYDVYKSTIECSRSATGVFGAYAALKSLGHQGFQVAVANSVQNVAYLSNLLQEGPLSSRVKLIKGGLGPSIGLRIYPDDTKCSSAGDEFEWEFSRYKATDVHPDYLARVDRNIRFHRRVYERRNQQGLFTDWVKHISHSRFDQGSTFKFAGEKIVMLNPQTSFAQVDEYMDRLAEAVEAVDRTWSG